jgi:hypothetical protein
MQVGSDFNPEADFSGLRTYAWRAGPQGVTDDPRIDDEALEARIRAAIDDQLASQGFTMTTDGAPDFLVGFHAAVASKLEVNAINQYSGYAPGWGSQGFRYGDSGGYRNYVWGWEPPSTSVRSFDQGSLIIDVVKPESDVLIWRGTAQAEVDFADDEGTREKRVREAVARMLKTFPPK